MQEARTMRKGPALQEDGNLTRQGCVGFPGFPLNLWKKVMKTALSSFPKTFQAFMVH